MPVAIYIHCSKICRIIIFLINSLSIQYKFSPYKRGPSDIMHLYQHFFRYLKHFNNTVWYYVQLPDQFCFTALMLAKCYSFIVIFENKKNSSGYSLVNIEDKHCKGVIFAKNSWTRKYEQMHYQGGITIRFFTTNSW